MSAMSTMTSQVVVFLLIYQFTALYGSKESEESRLIKNLFEGYSKYAKPTLNASSSVQMLFGVELVQIMSVMMPTQVLKTKLWVRMKWKNELLTWDPSQYDGLTSIRLNAVDVWTPDLQLYEQLESSKSIADNVDGLLFKTQVILENDGTTYWNSPVTLSVSCELDVADFPYDGQLCKMKFGPWSSDVSSLNMTADTLPLTTDKYVESSEWQLISVTKKRNSNFYACCAIPFSDVTVSLEIRRKPLFYWFNLVIPYAILLLCLWIGCFVPPHSSERISLNLVILLAFSIIVQATSSYLPRSSELPALSILYFVVMIEVALSALVTCAIVRIHFTSELGDKAPMPEWIHKYLLIKGEDFLSKIGLLSRIMRRAEVTEVSISNEIKEHENKNVEEESRRKNSENEDEHVHTDETRSANEISVSYRKKKGSLWKCSIGLSEANQLRERPSIDSNEEGHHVNYICCHNESKLYAILGQIRTLSTCYHNDITSWELSHKWQRLAVVLDRIFFVFLSLFTVVTFITFTVIKPAVHTHKIH